MRQLFDPDSPGTSAEWQRGTCFARAAALIERFECVPARGGANVWSDLCGILRDFAEHYRRIGMTPFAEKLELLAARARAAALRHRFYGPPLPPTLHHPREILGEAFGS